MRPCAGRASRTRPARRRTARSVTSNAAPGSPSSTNRPFLVPTSSSVMRFLPRSRAGRRPGRRPATGVSSLPLLAVDEHVDVAADPVALVEDPAVERRLSPFEVLQQLADRRARDAMLAAAGERLQRSAQATVHGDRRAPGKLIAAGSGGRRAGRAGPSTSSVGFAVSCMPRWISSGIISVPTPIASITCSIATSISPRSLSTPPSRPCRRRFLKAPGPRRGSRDTEDFASPKSIAVLGS